MSKIKKLSDSLLEKYRPVWNHLNTKYTLINGLESINLYYLEKDAHNTQFDNIESFTNTKKQFDYYNNIKIEALRQLKYLKEYKEPSYSTEEILGIGNDAGIGR